MLGKDTNSAGRSLPWKSFNWNKDIQTRQNLPPYDEKR